MKHSHSSRKSGQNNLDLYFNELKKESYSKTFPEVSLWLRRSDSNLSIKQKDKFYIMKNYIAANKLKLAYTFIILTFVVAACNYPVAQEETAGDVLKWTVDGTNTEAVKKIENFEWFRNGQHNVNVEKSAGNSIIEYQLIVPKENHSRLNDYRKELEAISGVMTLNIIPLNETVKRPVYSALLNNLFKIDINATNMSNEELAKEIDTQLKNAGIENAVVNFEKAPNGGRSVRLSIPEQDIKKEGGFDMTVKDGNNVNRFKELRRDRSDVGGADRFKDKTDSEIKDMVREDTGDRDLTDDQIKIKREGDRVMIEVNKTGVSDEKNLELKVK